jgi:IMP dehydrogenase
MAYALNEVGAMGILHRYQGSNKTVDAIRNLRKLGSLAVPSIGTSPEDIEAARQYIEAGADAICIDVAHGYHKSVKDQILRLREIYTGVVIAGNVATGEGAVMLASWGADVIKVGIGPGSMCTTRTVTGHGIPQFSAIRDVVQALEEDGLFTNTGVIADGGMRNSGDIVKALAAGADAVMTGSLIAGCKECPMPNQYRGMASKTAQLEFRGKVNNSAPEGESVSIKPHLRPVANVIEELAGGIRSGFSYTGARSLKEFQARVKWVEVSGNTVRENGAHGKENR